MHLKSSLSLHSIVKVKSHSISTHLATEGSCNFKWPPHVLHENGFMQKHWISIKYNQLSSIYQVKRVSSIHSRLDYKSHRNQHLITDNKRRNVSNQIQEITKTEPHALQSLSHYCHSYCLLPGPISIHQIKGSNLIHTYCLPWESFYCLVFPYRVISNLNLEFTFFLIVWLDPFCFSTLLIDQIYQEPYFLIVSSLLSLSLLFGAYCLFVSLHNFSLAL